VKALTSGLGNGLFTQREESEREEESNQESRAAQEMTK
jgi:hypothetical protein